jgi:hypothetical protein
MLPEIFQQRTFYAKKELKKKKKKKKILKDSIP